MLIIGSTAIKFYYPDFKREPKDFDIVGDKNPLIINDIMNEWGPKKIEQLENTIITKYQKIGYLTPNLLLSLKISHMFFDINWFKHMYDIQFLLDKGCKYDIKIVEELKEYWLGIHKKIRRSNLITNKSEFFDNAVNEDTDQHDHIHTLINPIPMYTLLLKDGADVELDESKFHKLTFEQKCDVVYEETAVMAWERYKVNHWREAYKIQLKDNIIKHFPPYIAMFAIENYKDLEKPKENYRQLINSKL